MFWETGNTVQSLFHIQFQPCRWKSTMAAITKRILLTTSKCNAIRFIRRSGFPCNPLKLYSRMTFKGLRFWQWKRSPMEFYLAYFQDGCHTHSRNSNHHNSVTNQLIFMTLVSKVWFSGMLNPIQGLKNSLITTKTQKPRWLPILAKI